MTDKEKIIQEIERRIHFLDGMVNTDFGRGSLDTLNKVLDFINSLPAEQQSEELNKEIDRFIGDRVGKTITVGQVAHYFAQWQKEQMMKSAVDATCVLLPPPDLFKVLICHDVTNNLSKGQKVKIITVTVKEDEQ